MAGRDVGDYRRKLPFFWLHLRAERATTSVVKGKLGVAVLACLEKDHFRLGLLVTELACTGSSRWGS